MAKRDAVAPYPHPGSVEEPERTFWLGGKNHGKSLAEAPEQPRGHFRLKIDHDAAEVELKARELRALGDVGRLKVEVDQAADVAELKKRQLAIAERMQSNTWLAERYMPPKPPVWPLYALVAALTLGFAALALQALYSPTLPSSFGGNTPPVPQNLPLSRKGRADR